VPDAAPIILDNGYDEKLHAQPDFRAGSLLEASSIVLAATQLLAAAEGTC